MFVATLEKHPKITWMVFRTDKAEVVHLTSALPYLSTLVQDVIRRPDISITTASRIYNGIIRKYSQFHAPARLPVTDTTYTALTTKPAKCVIGELNGRVITGFQNDFIFEHTSFLHILSKNAHVLTRYMDVDAHDVKPIIYTTKKFCSLQLTSINSLRTPQWSSYQGGVDLLQSLLACKGAAGLFRNLISIDDDGEWKKQKENILSMFSKDCKLSQDTLSKILAPTPAEKIKQRVDKLPPIKENAYY